MDLPADIGVGGSGTGVGVGHAPIPNGREQHGHHTDQNGRHDMTLGLHGGGAKERHRGRGLNQDNPIQDQCRQTEDTFQTWGTSG